MAKTKAPLLSMRASGALGQSHIYSQWRGVTYAKQYVIPANPRTSDQMLTRNTFRFIQSVYRQMGPGGISPWEIYAQGRPFTPRNGLTKTNLRDILGTGNLDNWRGSPGARGGPAIADFDAEQGAAQGEIDWEITQGVLPSGWSVREAVCYALTQQDPATEYDQFYTEQVVPFPGPYAGTFTGLNPGGVYMTTGFVVYDRPDGTRAVSPSGTVIATARP